MDDTTRRVGDADDSGATGGQPDTPGSAGARTTRRTQSRGGSAARTTRSKRASADTGLDRDTDVRTRKIQAEIAETRDELSDTVEAIQEKLRPSNLVSKGTDAVKTATTERIRDMTDTARESAYDIMETTRQNPWPALMIGAGVAWLLLGREGRSESGKYRMGRYRSAGWSGRSDDAGRSESARDEDWVQYSDYGDAGAYRREPGTYGGARSWSGTTGTASSMRDVTRRAQNGLQRMLHENPLLVAAAAVLTGAAVGGALPLTDRENELMGEARDRVVDRAQDVAREAADSVKGVANAVQQVAAEVTHPNQP